LENQYFPWAVFTLAKFFPWNCWRQQHVEENIVLGQNNKNMIICICVTLPMVAKASIALSVTCCYRKQFHEKIDYSFKQYLHLQSSFHETVCDNNARKKIMYLPLPPRATQHKYNNFYLCHFAKGGQGK
jgi:hypothetical protein